MTATDLTIPRLYRATFLFGMACGISIALTALHLNARGFAKHDIGTLAAWFAGGIVLTALPAGSLIRRFSAKRTLLGALALYTVCVTVFPFLTGYAAVAGVRAVDGACSACIWVSSETLLLANAPRERKAHLTSLYAVWLSLGYVAGSLLAWGVTELASRPVAFVVAGAFALAAVAYVALRVPADRPVGREAEGEAEGLGAGASGPVSPSLSILAKIKNSCFATFVYGYFQASVVLFLPLYLTESKGIAEARTVILPGLFAFGMLLFSNVAGRVADRVGHLAVMRALGAVGTCMILGFIFLDSYPLMCAAVFLAGATLAAISPVSLALQGVVTEARDYGRANALYNAFYAAGMLGGPWISSLIFEARGGRAMLYHLAAFWVAFIVFSIVFYLDDPAASRHRLALVRPAAGQNAAD